MTWSDVRCAMAVVLVGLGAVRPAGGGAARDAKAPDAEGPPLRVALVVDAKEPLLAFSRGVSPGDGAVRDSLPNGVYVLHPHGYVFSNRFLVDRPAGGRGGADEAAPPAPARHEVRMHELEGSADMYEPGEYRLYWQNPDSGERSNEVVLVRRKPGPREPRGLPGAKHLLGTPVNAVRTFYQGVNGDVGAINAIYVEPGDAAQEQVKGQFWELAIHSRALRAAAKDRYGTDGGDTGWYFDHTEGHLRGLDDATVTYPPYFEEAVVTPTDGVTGPIRVVRRNGDWHVPASSALKKGQPDPEIAKSIEAARQTTEEIKAGHHPTLRDAREAMRKRVWPGKKNKPGAEDEPARSADRVGAPDAGK